MNKKSAFTAAVELQKKVDCEVENKSINAMRVAANLQEGTDWTRLPFGSNTRKESRLITN